MGGFWISLTRLGFNKSFPWVVALLLAVGFFSPANAQQGIDPVTLKKESPQDGLTLGSGVSLARIFPTYESPFKEIKASREVNNNPIGLVKMDVVTSSKALDAA